jgi:hypothetical protein
MHGKVLMDGRSRLDVPDEYVTVTGTSGGHEVCLVWRRSDADQMAAEYFDKIVEGRGPPAALACFVNGVAK